MKITKLDGHTGWGKVSFLEKKTSGRVVKNYPKGDINYFLCNYKFFCPGLFCPTLSGKTNFPTTCPSVIQKKKTSGRVVKNYSKGGINYFLCNYKFFCPGLFCPTLSGKTNFPTTCPSVIQKTIFWHFSEL